MRVVDRYIFAGEVRKALKVALRNFKFHPNLITFAELMQGFMTMRRIRSARKLLSDNPELASQFRTVYPSTVAAVRLRSLNIPSRRSLLEGLPPNSRAWILATMGDVKGAMRTVEENGLDGFIRDYVLILRGRRPKLEVPFPHRMSGIYNDYLRALYMVVSGRLDTGLQLLGQVAATSLRSGYVGWGGDTLMLQGLVEPDPAKIEAAMEIYRSLGDRFSLKLAQVFALPFRREEVNVPPLKRYNIQLKYARAIARSEKVIRAPNDPLGYYALWWYASKRIRNITYLSFAGRLRIMEGGRELKLPRYERSRIVLAFYKLFGRDGKNFAHLIFPGSSAPRRRYEEYLSRVKHLRACPMDVGITLRYGTFLQDESEPWALFLKDRLLPETGNV
ncbi:MAG: hypothetical protein GXO29_07205 [Thermotogae bacterium]|nr:hypothetical protein [Thermotogota bacterium]